MPLPLHIATIISVSTIGMRLLKIRNCFVFLVITVRESSKRRGPIIMKQLLALFHLSVLDPVTSGGFATVFLTGGSLPYILFLTARSSSQHLLTKLTSLLGIFHAIPPLTMVSNSFPIFHLVLSRHSSKKIAGFTCNLRS